MTRSFLQCTTTVNRQPYEPQTANERNLYIAGRDAYRVVQRGRNIACIDCDIRRVIVFKDVSNL